MPSNNIAFAQNYTSVIDEVYQRASVSGVLNSGRRMVRAGRNAKEILSVTGLGNYTRNVGYKTGAITYEFETKTFNYDRGIRLFADVMDVEEAGVNDRFVEAGAEDILEDLRTVTAAMDKKQVTLDSRILFITPTLKGVLDDFSYANPNRSNRVLERFSRIVERSAVIKFDKHVASRVFSPDELEALDSYMMKYRKYGIVELFDNKLDGVYVSASTE